MSFAGWLKRKYSNIKTLPAETGSLESKRDPLPYGLKILADGVDPVLDIVAVHGLNGHRENTWTVNGVNWLCDFLPLDIPNARIYSWGYDANTHNTSSFSAQYLYDHATTLISDLCLKRRRTNTYTRPIIFIAHSLGGIVVKSALIHSESAREGALEEHRSIKLSTSGILFMGTPHQGGSGVHFWEIMRNMASIFMTTNDGILRHIERDSEWLQQQLGQYAPISRDFITKFAYEMLPTPISEGKTMMIVPRPSAVVPGAADAESIAIPANHLNMVRFASREDGGYEKVSEHLWLLAEKAPHAIAARWEKQDKIKMAQARVPDQEIGIAKLPVAEGASFDSHIDEHKPRCLANTRVELQRQIKEWANDRKGKPIFWLKGMAGTGKSTIARTIAQLLADDGRLGASFFFKKGEGDCGTASRFVTTIANDLMTHLPEIISSITKAINADPAISKKTLKDQFEKLILQPLLETKQAPPNGLGLVIVIDALDECEREKDIQVILQLLARTRDLGPVSLRVFVTSRPELPIRLGFKRMLDGTYQDLILHDIPNKTIEHDLALFLDHELKVVSEQRSLPLGWPSKYQIQALVKMAIPLFIFAATICRYIGDKRDNPKKRLEIVLQYRTANQVSQLDKTYLPILNQLFDEEDELDKERRTSEFREIVGSIVVLESPLSIVSLAHLLNIPKEDISCRLDLLHSVLNIPVDEDIPIRLLHLSFRDFLLDTQKRGKSPFWVNKEETHKRLASKCLQLLSSPKGLRKNMCNLTRPGTLRSEVDCQIIDSALSLEVRYACRYWVHHLEQSGGRICDGDLVQTFLQKYFLYWLEAMSFIGEASESIKIINSLQSLTDADESAAIFPFLHDGKRFVLRYRSILEDAPLQLYSSALIFAPEMCIIRTTFDNHIPIWVTRLPKMQKDWDALMQTLEGHSSRVIAVAFSPDGQLVASASDDGTVRLWDAGTGSCRSTLKGHSSFVNAVAFSPDGQLVASASDDKVRLWDAGTGSCRSTLEGHSSLVNAVAFSPHGQLVASASYDKTVRLWDAGTGSCRSTHMLFRRTDNVTFSCDGSHLITDSGKISIPLCHFSSPPFGQKNELYDIFVQNDWLTFKGQRFLWLAPDYRVTCIALCGNILCLGHASGNFTFFEFDFESMPPTMNL